MAGGFLAGAAAGLTTVAAAKRAKDIRKDREARDDRKSTLANLDAIDAKNTAGLEAGDYGAPSAGEREAEENVNLADGGMVGKKMTEKSPMEKYGISGAMPPKTDSRDQGKKPKSQPAGVRGDAEEFRTEVTAFLANGGMVPEPIGYATGGLLLGNTIPGGYTQHASYITTSDPLWHMQCHRDFGKKG